MINNNEVIKYGLDFDNMFETIKPIINNNYSSKFRPAYEFIISDVPTVIPVVAYKSIHTSGAKMINILKKSS